MSVDVKCLQKLNVEIQWKLNLWMLKFSGSQIFVETDCGC